VACVSESRAESSCMHAVLSLAQRLVVCLSLPQGTLECAQVHSRSSFQLVNSSERCDALCDGQWVQAKGSDGWVRRLRGIKLGE
jgi:hypothetical protein